MPCELWLVSCLSVCLLQLMGLFCMTSPTIWRRTSTCCRSQTIRTVSAHTHTHTHTHSQRLYSNYHSLLLSPSTVYFFLVAMTTVSTLLSLTPHLPPPPPLPTHTLPSPPHLSTSPLPFSSSHTLSGAEYVGPRIGHEASETL